jgi:hypothetical protein
MKRTYVNRWRQSRRVMQILVLSASAAVLGLGAPMSTAWAQQSSAQVPDSLHPQTAPWPAPVGHRQPRRSDVPAGASKDEGAITPGQREFDRSLDICRC